jgi:hypothetical protein
MGVSIPFEIAIADRPGPAGDLLPQDKRGVFADLGNLVEANPGRWKLRAFCQWF